jgi:glycosyltransferase involved in cell wall biosynthesis
LHSLRRERSVSVVIPVYAGEQTLEALVRECAALFDGAQTPLGLPFRVDEVILVWDRGTDRSDQTIRELSQNWPQVRAVWLARNVGQHGATSAGIASSHSEWVVTMDEDGQHDPADIGSLLDAAVGARAQLVYGEPSSRTPHPWWRNAASRLVKIVNGRLLSADRITFFSSFRLILGEIARVVAATAGPSTYLDTALSWSVGSSTRVSVRSRPERRDRSGYDFRSLRRHFLRLILSSGPRPLRLIAGAGGFVASLGVAFGVWVIVGRFRGTVDVAGWASLMTSILILGGLVLLSISVVAAYLSIALRVLLGQPAFTIVDDENLVFDG